MLKKPTLIAMCGLMCASVTAVERFNKDAPALQVSVGLEYSDTLNPTLAEDSEGYGLYLSPRGSLVYQGEGVASKLDYRADLRSLSFNDPVLNGDDTERLTDYELGFTQRIYLSEKWMLDGHLAVSQDEQMFGSGLSRLRFDVLAPDRKRQKQAGLTLVYGRDTSERYMALSVTGTDIEYDDVNDYAVQFDMRRYAALLDIGIRISPATSFVAELSYDDDDFNDISREDSERVEAQVGIAWQPSGKTELEFLIGMYQRQFAVAEDSDGLTWQASIVTSPRQDWQISFSSGRQSTVSDSVLANENITDNTALAITYQFSEQWQTGIVLERATSEYISANAERQLDDDKYAWNLGLALKEFSLISLEVGRHERDGDSSFPLFEETYGSLGWQYEF